MAPCPRPISSISTLYGSRIDHDHEQQELARFSPLSQFVQSKGLPAAFSTAVGAMRGCGGQDEINQRRNARHGAKQGWSRVLTLQETQAPTQQRKTGTR
jgi:hypothetical protein